MQRLPHISAPCPLPARLQGSSPELAWEASLPRPSQTPGARLTRLFVFQALLTLSAQFFSLRPCSRPLSPATRVIAEMSRLLTLWLAVAVLLLFQGAQPPVILGLPLAWAHPARDAHVWPRHG